CVSGGFEQDDVSGGEFGVQQILRLGGGGDPGRLVAQEPSRFAALKIGFAPSPTTIVRVMLSRTTSSPMSECADTDSSPSSSISPSTAKVRRGRFSSSPRPIEARVFREARMDSGFAL